jgi:hypothetical protein
MTNEALIALLKKNPVSVGCGALSLLLVAGLYFRSDAIPAAEAELAQKAAEAERFAQNIKFSEKLKEQLDAITAANKEIDSRIVRASQVGNNTQYFYQLESETGVKLIDFRPLSISAAAKGSKANFMPVGFNVSVQGSLPQILDFLRSLEGGTRFARVLTASLSGSPANRRGPLTLAVSVELIGLP